MTSVLLWSGVVGTASFVAVWAVEGALRPGYRPAYHPVSALSLGDRGWVQITSFVVTGLLMAAFALGVFRSTGALVGATALGSFGLALIASGLFSMDPMPGYPPGTPADGSPEHSLQHRLHEHAGLVVFLAVPVACLALAPRLAGPWRGYTVVTAILGLGLFVWFGMAFERDEPHAGALQRALIVVDWAWVAALSVHLARSAPMPAASVL